MKKVLMVLVLALALSACGANNNEATIAQAQANIEASRANQIQAMSLGAATVLQQLTMLAVAIGFAALVIGGLYLLLTSFGVIALPEKKKAPQFAAGKRSKRGAMALAGNDKVAQLLALLPSSDDMQRMLLLKQLFPNVDLEQLFGIQPDKSQPPQIGHDYPAPVEMRMPRPAELPHGMDDEEYRGGRF